MTQEMITALEQKGFKRWQKGNFDRLYINATMLGLELSYYKTGNISSAYFAGEEISNSQGRRLKGAKTFIDVKTGKIHSDYSELEEAAAKLMAEIKEC